MHILLTGAAGFIGAHTAKALALKGHAVVGLDNYNQYYSVQLKRDRVKALVPEHIEVIEGDILDKKLLDTLAKKHRFDVIIHLAAQAGVRHSLTHPDEYIQSNVQGTNNILELARRFGIKKVVYASSSSVYGGNTKVPFSIEDPVDNPLSLYAATKRSNELKANVYSHLFGIDTVGLRFFTVYGPWGRPDMAAYLFADAIAKGETLKLFNNGEMERDFTYVDDIVAGILSALEKDLKGATIFNLGNAHTTALGRFIEILECEMGKTAEKEHLPMQPGDVPKTSADITHSTKAFGFKPTTGIEEGLARFVEWYKEYHGN